MTMRFIDDTEERPSKRKSLLDYVREERARAEEMKQFEEFLVWQDEQKKKKKKGEERKGLSSRETFMLMLGIGPLIALLLQYTFH